MVYESPDEEDQEDMEKDIGKDKLDRAKTEEELWNLLLERAKEKYQKDKPGIYERIKKGLEGWKRSRDTWLDFAEKHGIMPKEAIEDFDKKIKESKTMEDLEKVKKDVKEYEKFKNYSEVGEKLEAKEKGIREELEKLKAEKEAERIAKEEKVRVKKVKLEKIIFPKYVVKFAKDKNIKLKSTYTYKKYKYGPKRKPALRINFKPGKKFTWGLVKVKRK